MKIKRFSDIDLFSSKEKRKSNFNNDNNNNHTYHGVKSESRMKILLIYRPMLLPLTILASARKILWYCFSASAIKSQSGNQMRRERINGLLQSKSISFRVWKKYSSAKKQYKFSAWNNQLRMLRFVGCSFKGKCREKRINFEPGSCKNCYHRLKKENVKLSLLYSWHLEHVIFRANKNRYLKNTDVCIENLLSTVDFEKLMYIVNILCGFLYLG